MPLVQILIFLAILLSYNTPHSPVNKAVQKNIDELKSVAVKMELQQLAYLVYIDTIDGTVPNPRTFPNFIRRNALITTSRKDSAKDYWGTYYRFWFTSSQFLIVSAGPDRKFGTEDDIQAGYRRLKT